MTSTIDPLNSSIDGVIQWLRDQRRFRPNSPLSDLIELTALPPERLTDLACIDLIERKRLGQPTTVEDVLKDIPSLATNEASVLDLIDAELCVVAEMGQTIDLAEYAARFPELIHAIQALVKLDRGLPSHSLSLPPSQPPGQIATDKRPALETRFGNDQLIEPPPWFTREQIQYSSECSYLIRGRDNNENRAVALKVLKLTHAISKRDIDAVLSSVESASSVRHPAWISPDVAAVENGALAVIRPWIFGTRWDQARRQASFRDRLQDLARIGYALQAAHDTTTRHGHAAHGGIHLNNLIVDADGQLRILDAVACVQPAAGDIFGSKANARSIHLTCDQSRRQSDVRSLCALVRMVTVAVGPEDRDLQRQILLLNKRCEAIIAGPEHPTACALLADMLMKLSEGSLVDNDSGSLVTTAKTIWRNFLNR